MLPKLGAFAWILMLTTAAHVGGQEVHRADDDINRKVDWDLIDFHWDERYRLTKVRIEIRETVGTRFEDGKVIAAVVIDDKKTLAEFQEAFHTAKIAPPRRGDGGFGITSTAVLECETTTGSFKVYWNRCFLLNQSAHSYEASFWSMGLAAIIDRELRREKLAGLPAEVLEDLSGQRQLETERSRFGAK